LTAARPSFSVLHVSQPTEAGVAHYVLGLIADQRARGWEVSLAAPESGKLAAEARNLGAACHRWGAARTPGLATVTESLSLGRIVRRVEPDLVHLHSSKAGLAGRLWLRGRLPTIFQPHAWSFDAADGFFGATALAWERFAARWADVVLCVSEAEASRGRAAGVRADYRVIPSGVSLRAWAVGGPRERAEARGRLGLDQRPLAVCVGRLSRQKGQDLLLAAWPRVRRHVPEAALVLVGAGPEEARIRALAADGVELVGSREDVQDWYTAADVVVLPSRWEGMSLVPLEAMACARSVVATDVSGAREAIGDDAGAVVASGNPEGLAEALTERLNDPSLADAEGRAGRRRVEVSFDLRRTTEAVAALYAQVTRRKGASNPPSSSTEPTIP
jgi:glycosyltransferase involved in cell wall biosynthesis